jgi:hypothetical protein
MEQAAQAASLFAARDYAGCMAVLQQLRAEKEMDPKVSPHALTRRLHRLRRTFVRRTTLLSTVQGILAGA